MASSANELQVAIFSALTGSAEITAITGSDRIFDHVPINTPFPYLVFGRTTISDWSTGTEDGCEHIFTIHHWSKGKGKLQVLTMMSVVRDSLHNAALELGEHRLINLRCEVEEVRHDEDVDAYHGMTRFRAVTEPV